MIYDVYVDFRNSKALNNQRPRYTKRAISFYGEADETSVDSKVPHMEPTSWVSYSDLTGMVIPIKPKISGELIPSPEA